MLSLIKYSGLIIIVLYFCPHQLAAQDESIFKNRILTSLYKIETIIEPINGKKQISRLFNGIIYQRALKKDLAIIGGIEYGEKGVNDNCIDCQDQYYGKGLFKELSFLLGVKYNMSNPYIKGIYPVLQIGLYYSRSTFSGNYNGGLSSLAFQFEDIYNKYGGIGKIGLEANITRNLYLNLLTGYRTGKYSKEQLFQNNKSKGTYSNWFPIELSVGMAF